MNLHHRLAFTCALAMLPAGSAIASDLISVPTSTSNEVTIHDEPGFNWSGFYAGVYGSGQADGANGNQYGPGVQAGVNEQFDFYLVGAEVSVHGLVGGDVGNSTYGQVLGRAGLVVSDNVLVYAAGGYGIDLGPSNESDALLGGGVELAVTEDLSVETQYLHGFPLDGGDAMNQVTFGANFHF